MANRYMAHVLFQNCNLNNYLKQKYALYNNLLTIYSHSVNPLARSSFTELRM